MTRALLAKVHIAKKELALSDESYRAILSRVTGHESSADCSEGQLERLFVEFRRLGWAPQKGTRAPAPKHVRLIYALWKEAGVVGAVANATKEALRAFVLRQTGKAAPEFCTPSDANRVSEGLKAMIRRAGERR
jgi:phage gp16-like protein